MAKQQSKDDGLASTLAAFFIGIPMMLLSLIIVIGIFWFVGSLVWSMIFG